MSMIHYMFSDKCGNNLLFESMDSFIEYASGYAGKSLIIEFVDIADEAAVKVVSDGLLKTGAYSEQKFREALSRKYSRVLELGGTHLPTRRLYIASCG